MNAPCPFPVITFGRVQQPTHQKVMTGDGQLTRGAFIINDFLRNPHYRAHKTPILHTTINLFVLPTSDIFEIDICRSLTNQTLLFCYLLLYTVRILKYV